MPKLRNRWSDEELRSQAEKRPTKFLRDLHSRGVRGEISKQDLDLAAKDMETLLDGLEATLDPGPWIIGNEFSLADVAIAPYMFRLSPSRRDAPSSTNSMTHILNSPG